MVWSNPEYLVQRLTEHILQSRLVQAHATGAALDQTHVAPVGVLYLAEHVSKHLDAHTDGPYLGQTSLPRR